MPGGRAPAADHALAPQVAGDHIQGKAVEEVAVDAADDGGLRVVDAQDQRKNQFTSARSGNGIKFKINVYGKKW